jgi:predicted nucleic acid-binding protein
MGQKFLLDTNIVIDALDGKMPTAVLQKIDLVASTVSAATYMEALGWHQVTETQLRILQSFMEDAIILPIDKLVMDVTVLIRQQKKVELGDAIIAATAIVHNMILVTRNVGDFKSIDNLTLYNPWE